MTIRQCIVTNLTSTFLFQVFLLFFKKIDECERFIDDNSQKTNDILAIIKKKLKNSENELTLKRDIVTKFMTSSNFIT